MVRIFFFVLGFVLISLGFSYFIMCLNVIGLGYNLLEYVQFIVSGFTFYLWIMGFIIIIFSVIKGDKIK